MSCKQAADRVQNTHRHSKKKHSQTLAQNEISTCFDLLKKKKQNIEQSRNVQFLSTLSDQEKIALEVHSNLMRD